MSFLLPKVGYDLYDVHHLQGLPRYTYINSFIDIASVVSILPLPCAYGDIEFVLSWWDLYKIWRIENIKTLSHYLWSLPFLQSQHSQACESAFEEWLKTKRKQRQRDEYVDKQRMKEERSHWDVRPRQECDKAFKQWVYGRLDIMQLRITTI